MLMTAEHDRRNRRRAVELAGVVAVAAAVAGCFSPLSFLLLGLCPFAYWCVRRRCLRRLAIMRQPFPAS